MSNDAVVVCVCVCGRGGALEKTEGGEEQGAWKDAEDPETDRSLGRCSRG